MKKIDRLALVYGASIVGAGALAWYKGKRGVKEIATDAFLQGAVVGTGATVILFLADDSNVASLGRLALTNKGQESCSTYGKVSGQGLKLLAGINPDVLYRAAKLGRDVIVGPEPEDPNVVQLPNPG
jgi:hypothetical protein